MLFNYRTKLTLKLVTALFTFFLLFAVYGTVIGLNIDCGCFSNVVRSEFGITMILRNLIFILITTRIIYEQKIYKNH